MRADERPFNARDKRSVCREIAADMERDAQDFDGRPLNGRTVAEYFGNQGAAIAALALIVEQSAGTEQRCAVCPFIMCRRHPLQENVNV